MTNTFDFLFWEKTLAPEYIQIIHTAREALQKQIVPHVQLSFRNELPIPDLANFLGKLGALGANISEKSEPPDYLAYGLLMRELERVDSGVRSFASVQSALVMFPISQFGSDDQKQTWLSKLRSGESVGCFGLTEAHGGSDPSKLKTKATYDGTHYTLNGSKMWITNGHTSDIAIIWAQTENGIRGFIVPTNIDGYYAHAIAGKFSLRASATSEINLQGLRIPESYLLPKSQGLGSALGCLDQARFGIAWGVLGAAEDCLQEALHYAKDRTLFNKQLSQMQITQTKFANMATQISMGQALVMRLTELKSKGLLESQQISMGKMACCEIALDVSRSCRSILGAAGITDEFHTIRHMLNLESVATYEGTHEIHQLAIGRALTGESAF